MKKKLFVILVAMIMVFSFTSCHDSKTFKRPDGTEFVAEPYGWANDYKKVEGVIYEPVLGNIVWSIFCFETVIVPVWLTGWDMMEPVEYNPDLDPTVTKSHPNGSWEPNK